jgi:predicted dehydrogenase
MTKHEDESSMNTDVSRRDFLEWSGSAAMLASAGLLTQAGRAWPSESGKKIRMAVVGGGFGATFHWHEHPKCVVTGVTDLRPDRRERLKRRYKCDKAYDSLEIMIKEAKDIDAVAIFSGGLDHVKHVKMCMENGWHVVSACPTCVTLEEAQVLKDIKEKTGLRYMMAESTYYRQETIFARNMYEAGGFGELFYSETEYYHDRGDLKQLAENKKSRFFNPDGSHSWRWGYPPMFYPTHSIAFLVGVTGERMTKVTCHGWGDGKHPCLTDNAYDNTFWNETALMKTNKGHAMRCNVFWLVADHGERAQWYGDKATLFMPKGGIFKATKNLRRGKPRTAEIEVPQYYKTSDMIPEPMRHGSGHGGSAIFISAEFINALLQDREPAVDVYEALAMCVPGLVAHQSAMKDGEQLKVPQFEA